MSAVNQSPTCWIIAGPNGAGKTSFALEYLPNAVGSAGEGIHAAGRGPRSAEGGAIQGNDGDEFVMEDRQYGQQALEALKEAVANALERKRRKGQYAAVWRDGQMIRLSPEQLGSAGEYASEASASPFTVRDTDERKDREGNPRESGKEGGP